MQEWSGASCTHTKSESNPWWSVDLQAATNVEQVKVWNRADCCQSRLNGFQVLPPPTLFTDTQCLRFTSNR